MYEKGQQATISFYYGDVNGDPVSGAFLNAVIRTDYSTWRNATYAPIESSPGLAPGFYDLRLSAADMDCDHLAWYVKSQGGVFVAQGQFNTNLNPTITSDTVFDAVYGVPSESADLAARSTFMDTLADHILRRAMASAERSTEGDAVGASSLLGVISILTQGQMVVTNCTGDSWIYLNSSIQGNPPLGALRVVNNSAGVPIGVLPLSGPNSVADPTQNCECG